jgi:hypothetical protein
VFASLLSVTGILIAAAVFVVLFVILSVPLWVSIVAAVGALALWAVIGGAGVAGSQHRAHPGRG